MCWHWPPCLFTAWSTARWQRCRVPPPVARHLLQNQHGLRGGVFGRTARRQYRRGLSDFFGAAPPRPLAARRRPHGLCASPGPPARRRTRHQTWHHDRAKNTAKFNPAVNSLGCFLCSDRPTNCYKNLSVPTEACLKFTAPSLVSNARDAASCFCHPNAPAQSGLIAIPSGARPGGRALADTHAPPVLPPCGTCWQRLCAFLGALRRSRLSCPMQV